MTELRDRLRKFNEQCGLSALFTDRQFLKSQGSERWVCFLWWCFGSWLILRRRRCFGIGLGGAILIRVHGTTDAHRCATRSNKKQTKG